MPAGVHVIAECIPDEPTCLREFIRGRAFLSEELKGRTSGNGGEKFALGIGPVVSVASLKENRAGSHERDQTMCVDGQLAGVLRVLE